MTDTCLVCRFFVQHRRHDRDVGADVNLSTGDCRRFPPRARLARDATSALAVFPMVDKADACGEFSARPA